MNEENEEKLCTCEDKEQRYCKGCYANVTETMFCYCGEFHLIKSETLSEEELKTKL